MEKDDIFEKLLNDEHEPKVNHCRNLKITKEDLRENITMKRYLVALQVGGIMEHPEYTYQDYQIIEAKSKREAEDIYNKKNNCNYYYGSVIRVLGYDENYVPEIDGARKTCITPVSFRETNRDKLLNKSLYDLLSEINDSYDGFLCIIENLEADYRYDKEKFRCRGSATKEDCSKCIQRYLNEEVK